MKIQNTYTFHLSKQVPVLQRERLGSVPHDAYVVEQDGHLTTPEPKPLPTKKLEFDGGTPVYADNPVIDPATGQLKSKVKIEFVEEQRYGILPSSLSAAAGGVLGSVAASMLGGHPVSWALTGGVALASLALGGLNGVCDQVTVVDRQVPVFRSELKGYTHNILEGDPARGRLHQYIPDTEAKEVGRLPAQELRHRALKPAAAAAVTFMAGLTAGMLLG